MADLKKTFSIGNFPDKLKERVDAMILKRRKESTRFTLTDAAVEAFEQWVKK